MLGVFGDVWNDPALDETTLPEGSVFTTFTVDGMSMSGAAINSSQLAYVDTRRGDTVTGLDLYFYGDAVFTYNLSSHYSRELTYLLSNYARGFGSISIAINNDSPTPFTDLAQFYQDRVRASVEQVLQETDGVSIRQWALESDFINLTLETMTLPELVEILTHVAVVGR